jgi:hypothetical protein
LFHSSIHCTGWCSLEIDVVESKVLNVYRQFYHVFQVVVFAKKDTLEWHGVSYASAREKCQVVKALVDLWRPTERRQAFVGNAIVAAKVERLQLTGRTRQHLAKSVNTNIRDIVPG